MASDNGNLLDQLRVAVTTRKQLVADLERLRIEAKAIKLELGHNRCAIERIEFGLVNGQQDFDLNNPDAEEPEEPRRRKAAKS